jgi:DNA-binding IclR family transcriptional regulator
MGVTELAQKTSLLPSDVHRILTSLKPYGFIEQDAQSKKYHLGLEPLKLGHVVLKRMWRREMCRPLLQRLSEELEATTNMEVFDPRELEIICVEQIDSPREILKTRIGMRAPAHSTAPGKVLLCHMDRETAHHLLKYHGMERLTKNTITTLVELEQQLEIISERGYAVDREETVEGICCISAPLRNQTGAVVAAISVSMMASRFYRWTESQLAAAIHATATKFYAALGYKPSNSKGSRAAAGRAY